MGYERVDMCLYKHQVENEVTYPHESQPHQENTVTCRSCKNQFGNKHDMMSHRKKDYLNEVKDCKNFIAGLNCRMGPEWCWYRHDRTGTKSTSTLPKSTSAPSFNLQNFPHGPTPQGVVVGQSNVDLQVIQQTLIAQQQQMTVMMTEILKLQK